MDDENQETNQSVDSKPTSLVEELLERVNNKLTKRVYLESTYGYLKRDLGQIVQLLEDGSFQKPSCLQCFFTRLFKICLSVGAEKLSLRAIQCFTKICSTSTWFSCPCSRSPAHMRNFLFLLKYQKRLNIQTLDYRLFLRMIQVCGNDRNEITHVISYARKIEPCQLALLICELNNAVESAGDEETIENLTFALKRIGYTLNFSNNCIAFSSADLVLIVESYARERELLKHFFDCLCLCRINNSGPYRCLLDGQLSDRMFHDEDSNKLKLVAESPFFEDAFAKSCQVQIESQEPEDLPAFVDCSLLISEIDDKASEKMHKIFVENFAKMDGIELACLCENLMLTRRAHFVDNTSKSRPIIESLLRETAEIRTLPTRERDWSNGMKFVNAAIEASAWFGDVEILAKYINSFLDQVRNSDVCDLIQSFNSKLVNVSMSGMCLEGIESQSVMKADIITLLLRQSIKLMGPCDSQFAAWIVAIACAERRYGVDSDIVTASLQYIGNLEDAYIAADMVGRVFWQEEKTLDIKELPSTWRIITALCEKVVELVTQNPKVLRRLDAWSFCSLLRVSLSMGQQEAIEVLCRCVCEVHLTHREHETFHLSIVRDANIIESARATSYGIDAFTRIVDTRIMWLNLWLEDGYIPHRYLDDWDLKREINEMEELKINVASKELC